MIDEGAKRALEHTTRWFLQHLRRFHLRLPGRDTLGTLADWAGRKVGSVVCLATRTGETVPRPPVMLKCCMRVSSYLQPIILSFIVMKLARDVLREIPRDKDRTRPVMIRRAVP